jgi:predicted dehydrogenase
MIRLAVSAPDALVSALAARLHDASVVSAGSETPGDCSAWACLDPGEDAAERARAALASGQDVLLLAGSWLSDGALDRLSAAARESGRTLAVLNPERFVPSRRLIREQLTSGHLGRPGLVRMHRWAHSAGAGGELPVALLLDLDVAMWLVGETPDLAYALETQSHAIQVHLGFPGGGMALLDFWERPSEQDSYQSLSVIGSSGAAYADDHQNMQLVFAGAGAPRAHRVSEDTNALVALVQSFVTGLGNPAAHADDGSSSWARVLEVAHAARRSVESHQAVGLTA